MTDSQFLLHVLKDGGWHSRDSILARSFDERGCGLTIHSRAADLRKQGHDVKVEVRGGSRRASFYRLGALNEPAACANGSADDSPSLVSSVAAGSLNASNPGLSLADGSVGAGAGAFSSQRSLFDQPFVCHVDESGGQA